MSDTSPAGADHKYPQIVSFVRETPWAILPAKLAEIKAMLAERAAGRHLTAEEIQARIGSGPPRRDLQIVGTVAVVPVYGVITARADLFTDISGGTSVQRLQSTFADALSDQDITAIVLDIDSPGGSVNLLPEVASLIRGSRGKKPIVAVASTMAASAAYWIGSQADEMVVTPSGQVGSVGVIAAHEDISGFEEKLGVKTTLITYGEFKAEGNPFEPLSDEAHAAIQKTVDEFGAMFDSDVAKGRRVPISTVREQFGQGRMFTAKSALKAGMVDRIDTLEATVQRVARGRVAVSIPDADPPDLEETMQDDEAAASGLSFGDAVDSALRAFDHVVTGAEALRALTGRKREQLAELIERGTGLLATTTTEDDETALDDGGYDAEFEWHLARLR